MTTQAMRKEVEILKEEVREKLLVVCDDPLKCLQYVNTLELLGVAYHFSNEIEQGLQHVYQSYRGDREDLYITSLQFRLLRQHGYYTSCEVFNKFKDEKGSFKEFIATDVQGMLALYEASYLRVRGEDILDEALAFTTAHLKSVAAQLSYPLSAQVAYALKLPMQRYFSRVDHRHHISVYESDPSCDKRLAKFAKLDFNVLQSLHRKELRDLARWWQGFDFATELRFMTRARLVEYFYFYTVTHYEPQYARLRVALTKISSILTFIDDLHDSCNFTIEELELLNEALERWDKNNICQEQLPDCMEEIITALFNVMEEIEQDLVEEGRSWCFHYAIEELKALSRGNFRDAKWRFKKQIPSYEEYLSNSLECSIERDGEVSSITCYMKEFNVPMEQAFEELCKKVDEHWKDFNQEMIRPTLVTMPILNCILNLLRSIEINHIDRDDLFTLVTPQIKENISKLLMEPI